MVDIFTPRRSATSPVVSVATEPQVAPSLRILVVCTANISRSPLAAVILERRLTDGRFPARVTSAGTRSTHLAVDPLSVVAAEDLGLTVSDHRPRKLTEEILNDEGADLIVPMAREHLREIVLVDRQAWSRTFTLKELVRLAEQRSTPATDVRSWLAGLSAQRKPHDLLGDDDADDIADTFGTSLLVHRRTAAEIVELADRFCETLRRNVPQG